MEYNITVRKLTKIGNSPGITLPKEMLYKLDKNKEHEIVFSYKRKTSNPEIWEIFVREKKK